VREGAAGVSIVNAWCERDQVLLVVDTASGGRTDGTNGELSKAFVLPHLNAVIAVRGYYAYMLNLVAYCLSFTGAFDELIERLPGVLEDSSDKVEKLFGLAGFAGHAGEPVHRVGILIAGWSPRLQRMHVVVFDRLEESAGFTQSFAEPGEGSFGPFFDELPRPETPVTFESLANIAKLQVRLTREQSPSAAIGGRLLSFQIGRDGMCIAPVAESQTRVCSD
jgi:hypothetical protein